jgi:hypothetical protein
MSLQTSTELPEAQANERPLIRRLYVVAGVVVVLALAGLAIWAVIWLARTQAGAIEAVRDIFIIGLSLISCVFGVVLLLLLVMVIRLVNMIEFEIKPILEKTNETVGMVRGTTVFMSRNVVRPVTTATSYVAAIRRGLRTLFGDPRRNLPD